MQKEERGPTRANSTNPSSAAADNRLRRAEVTAYSWSCCDEFLLGASGSGDLVRECRAGERGPLLLLVCDGEADRRLCGLPGGWRRKLMSLMNDMRENGVLSKRADGCSGEES
jgi:hypothetical protein